MCTSDVQLNNLTSDPMVCHLDFTCLGVDCCIQVDMARRTLRASLNLDPCSQIMTIALERFTINVDLTNYTFGRSTAAQCSTVWGKLVYISTSISIHSKTCYLLHFELSYSIAAKFKADNERCRFSVPVLYKLCSVMYCMYFFCRNCVTVQFSWHAKNGVSTCIRFFLLFVGNFQKPCTSDLLS